MSLARDARHGLRIARAEFARSLRAYTGNLRRLLGLGLAVLFFGGNLVVALPGAYVLGRSVRSVGGIPFFAPAATLLLVGLLLLAVLRTLERIGSVEAPDLVLLTVHPRAVVLGLITAEIARLALWFGVPLGAFVLAFSLGLGAPLLPATAGLVLLPALCCAAVWGYAGGLAVLRALRRLPTLQRVLKAVGLLAMVGVVLASQFVGQYLAEGTLSLSRVAAALSVAPIADYLALAFVGTPIAPATSPRAVAVLVALVASTPVGLAVATRQAETLWFTDVAAKPGGTAARESSGGFAPPWPFRARKAGRVAWGILVRARRHPQDLSHLLMAVFFVGPVAATVVQSSADALAVLLAAIGVGFGAYLAGATFGLNPLGDDRPQLPVVLLTETPPRTLVRGRVVAGLALGLPIAVLAPLASVPLGTHPLAAVVFAAVGVAMCLAAAHVAVGVGAAYPIYEEREFWGTESVVPSTLVMLAYLFVVGGGSVLGLAATWLAVQGALDATALTVGGLALYVALTAGVSYASFRYAVRRYRRYTID